MSEAKKKGIVYTSSNSDLIVAGKANRAKLNSVYYYGGYSIFVAPNSNYTVLNDLRWHNDSKILLDQKELSLTTITEEGIFKGRSVYNLSRIFTPGGTFTVTDVGRDTNGKLYNLVVTINELSNYGTGTPFLSLEFDGDGSLRFNYSTSSVFGATLSFVDENGHKPTNLVLNQLIGDIDGNQEVSTSFGNLAAITDGNMMTNTRDGNILTIADDNAPDSGVGGEDAFNRAPLGTAMMLSQGNDFYFKFAGRYWNKKSNTAVQINNIGNYTKTAIQFNLFGNADVVKVVTPTLKHARIDYHSNTV